MKIQEIAKHARFEDSTSVQVALKAMRKVPQHELHFYLVARDTLQTTSVDTRKIITLAQVELNRRSTNEMRILTVLTALVSGAVGVAGALLGTHFSK